MCLVLQNKDVRSVSEALSASGVPLSKCHFAAVTFKTHFKLENVFSLVQFKGVYSYVCWQRTHHSKTGAKPLASEDHHTSFLKAPKELNSLLNLSLCTNHLEDLYVCTGVYTRAV